VNFQQTLAELLGANQGYLNWLDSIGAEEDKREFVETLQRNCGSAFRSLLLRSVAPCESWWGCFVAVYSPIDESHIFRRPTESNLHRRSTGG